MLKMAETTRAGVFVCGGVSVRNRAPVETASQSASSSLLLHWPGSSATDNRKPEPTLELKIIGHIRSCFPMKRAIPRQGHLVPSSHAELTLRKGIAPSCLEGIEEYLTATCGSSTTCTGARRRTTVRSSNPKSSHRSWVAKSASSQHGACTDPTSSGCRWCG
jgi:hypothetical protein